MLQKGKCCIGTSSRNSIHPKNPVSMNIILPGDKCGMFENPTTSPWLPLGEESVKFIILIFLLNIQPRKSVIDIDLISSLFLLVKFFCGTHSPFPGLHNINSYCFLDEH